LNEDFMDGWVGEVSLSRARVRLNGNCQPDTHAMERNKGIEASDH
jgi:hypothetical protein